MTLPIPSGSYSIDAMHSQLGFAVRHLGISNVRGTFDSYTGTLNVGGDLGSTTVEIEAQMRSVNTGNKGRDEHVHGEGFFDTANHPTMSFRSTSIAAGSSDEDYVLNGDLTIRGITKPISLAVTFNGTGVFPMDQSLHAGFTASGSFNRSDFGVSYGVPMVSDKVKLDMELQFVAPKA